MGNLHYQTPKKARLRGAHDFLVAKGIEFRKTDLFEFFEVPARSGYRILKGASDRTRHYDPDLSNNRGKQRKITEKDLDKLEALYTDKGFKAKRLPWATAAIEARINTDATNQTIQRAAETRELFKRLAKEVNYKDNQEIQRRLQWATEALEERLNPEDWDNVIFSDKCHFSLGDKG